MNETILWSPGVTLEQIEKEVILKTFRHYRGNKTASANSLGISVRTLDSKLAQYKVEKEKLEDDKAKLQRKREEFLARSRGSIKNEGFDTSASIAAKAGIRVESAPRLPAQQNMSMSERGEVQELPFAKDAKSGTGSTGKKLR